MTVALDVVVPSAKSISRQRVPRHQSCIALYWTVHMVAQQRAGPSHTCEPNILDHICPAPFPLFSLAWSLSSSIPFHDSPDVLHCAPARLPPCPRRRQCADLLGHVSPFQCSSSVRTRTGRNQPMWDRLQPDLAMPECLQ